MTTDTTEGMGALGAALAKAQSEFGAARKPERNSKSGDRHNDGQDWREPYCIQKRGRVKVCRTREKVLKKIGDALVRDVGGERRGGVIGRATEKAEPALCAHNDES